MVIVNKKTGALFLTPYTLDLDDLCAATCLALQENLQIMRDYSLLQIHTRNYEAFADTRHQLLELRPQNRQFWIGLAIGYHMMGKPDLGVKVLTTYEETLKVRPEPNSEDSVKEVEQ